MKTFDNLTVRELLHIEDGYYGDTLIVAEKDEGSSGGGGGGGSSEIVLKATGTLPCPCECEYTPDQFRDAFQESSADGKMPSFKLVFFESTTDRDLNLTTTLWSNYVRFTEGMGGKAVEVSFTDINGSIYQVRGPYGDPSNPGLWIARKTE